MRIIHIQSYFFYFVTEHAGLVLYMFSEDMISCDEGCVHKAASQPRAGDWQGMENTMMNVIVV